MKRLAAMLLLLISPFVKAQDSASTSTSRQKYLFTLPEVKGLIMDVNYLNMPFQEHYLDGISVNVGTLFDNNFSALLAMDFTGSRNIVLDSAFPAITPGYNYYAGGLQVEYLYHPDNVLYFSVPVKASVAYAEYVDRYNTDNYYSNGRVILDDVFFMAEAGANAYVNLFKYVALGGGVRYHWAYGVSRIGTDADYRDISWNVSVRFRLTDIEN